MISPLELRPRQQDRVVIIGAGLAGQRAATALRAAGHGGTITLLGDEPIAAYERPALSKAMLAERHGGVAPAVPGGTADDMQRLDIRRQLGTRATAVDPDGVLLLEDGNHLAWDQLVFATGARPRALSGISGTPGVHALGSPVEAHALGRSLGPHTRLVTIGCGFIGAEVASSARARGAAVTIVEMADSPFEGILGREVGELLAGWYRSHGVVLHTGARTSRVDVGAHGRVAGVRLDDGRRLGADAVLVAAGVEPADELFHAAWPGRGEAGRGIPVDDNGRTLACGRVYACGDVASYPSRAHQGGVRRIEHWTHASQSAQQVARTIAGIGMGKPHLRFAWSDQFGVRLQVVGETAGAARVEVDDPDPTQLLVRYLDDDGALVGGLAGDRPECVAQWRRSIGADAPERATSRARAS